MERLVHCVTCGASDWHSTEFVDYYGFLPIWDSHFTKGFRRLTYKCVNCGREEFIREPIDYKQKEKV